MRILKYKLPTEPGWSPIEMPWIRRVLRFDLQNGEPHMWAIVDEERDAKYIIEVRWTGEAIVHGGSVISRDFHGGTVFLPTGLVVHYLITYQSRARFPTQ